MAPHLKIGREVPDRNRTEAAGTETRDQHRSKGPVLPKNYSVGKAPNDSYHTRPLAALPPPKKSFETLDRRRPVAPVSPPPAPVSPPPAPVSSPLAPVSLPPAPSDRFVTKTRDSKAAGAFVQPQGGSVAAVGSSPQTAKLVVAEADSIPDGAIHYSSLSQVTPEHLGDKTAVKVGRDGRILLGKFVPVPPQADEAEGASLSLYDSGVGSSVSTADERTSSLASRTRSSSNHVRRRSPSTHSPAESESSGSEDSRESSNRRSRSPRSKGVTIVNHPQMVEDPMRICGDERLDPERPQAPVQPHSRGPCRDPENVVMREPKKKKEATTKGENGRSGGLKGLFRRK